MKVTLFINKTVEENANYYFDKAKKMKKKADGANRALEFSRKDLEKINQKTIQSQKKFFTELDLEKNKVENVKHEFWFQKFRWTITSTGFLCVAARDATTNEIIIKKHTLPQDYVIHTELPGSPFCVIKIAEREGIDPETLKQTLYEAGVFTLNYSRTWKLGMSEGEVFWVNGDQLSKASEEGINVPKGSFVILGKKNFLKVPIELAIGLISKKNISFHSQADISFLEAKENKNYDFTQAVCVGTENLVATWCSTFVMISSGKGKSSDTAKKIASVFKKNSSIEVPLDDIIKVIPSGGSEVYKKVYK